MAGTAVDSLELAKASTEVATAMVAVRNAMSVVESLGKFASAAGAVGAVFGVAAAIVKLAMGNVESAELRYMKEQFQIVRNQLDVISGQIQQVLQAIEQSTVNNQYFPIEENLRNQFRKYMDILNTKPEYREKEKEEFLTHFDVTKGDQNLHTLYDAVMGYSAIFGKPILETAMEYDQRNRRLMEGLCCRLKELFCIGLIALVGHSAITGTDVEALKREWNEKMDKVENKMKSMIDRCINEFAEQAEIDVEKMINEKGGRNNCECVSYILNGLSKKYDWVKWSVRVYNPVSGFDNHCVIGPNRFHFFRHNGVNAVVSYAIDPKPINESHIKQLMEGKDGWSDAIKVAEHVDKHLPSGHVVHVVRRYKGLWYHSNIPASCHFWENYSGVTLCVHST
ncbi:protein rapunzel-like [Hemiscyllium ocellatum]|uniref:protein rapunzel-like n=1 Tax=Hemiscyllium ocellatum TaxID=170820 RepID=UPI002966ADC0|nr:protein rapunzel-like [Hemiscyllium ocellatum]XP_060681247.1 protein rapunzel-like [Hemiscyllium ocellatum]XP_060681248.1 protein rapunzel-like [Hemiscyllium ocellatum]XP_060681249.1 protein rapunzel-like [Hemiscyllium ocellatum]XP_060681250.1 protein rapunzel-like [Hemiscyllium ocellatum]XP_060681251.1 protein rapunzel-like [Hemiscyllium ocellatum]